MSFATKQATVADSATLICARRDGRRKITIVQHGTTVVYLGGVGVLTTTGAYLAGTAGAQVTIETSEAVYGIVATGTQAVSVIEHY